MKHTNPDGERKPTKKFTAIREVKIIACSAHGCLTETNICKCSWK